jgi:hypothetical protein
LAECVLHVGLEVVTRTSAPKPLIVRSALGGLELEPKASRIEPVVEDGYLAFDSCLRNIAFGTRPTFASGDDVEVNL